MNITKYENDDSNNVNEAVKLINNLNQENYSKAARILLDVLKHTSDNYVYKFRSDNKLFIKFWGEDEFIHFVTYNANSKNDEEVIWIPSAYPKAYYYFGILLNKAKKFDEAIWTYNKGLELEPSNPLFIIGLGNVYSSMRNHLKAIENYKSVGKVSPFISSKRKALALRSEGVQLIELNRLIDAKNVFMKSLELEPNNQNAINELLLIEKIEKGGKENFITPIISQINSKINKCMFCSKEVKEGVIRKINNINYFICKECESKNQ